MSQPLLQIVPPVGQHEPLLSDAERTRLNALYDRVPKVSCSACTKPGSCCELTKAEWDAEYATMYPLYLAEYFNIVDYVRTHFDTEQQQKFLSVVDERPKRCPFLTETGGCSIHPARPLTCRTYGVLNEAKQVDDAAKIRQADLPKFWVSAFLSTERYTVCDETRLVEKEKLDAHLDGMVSFDYERRMIALGQTVGALEPVRREIFEDATGKDAPIRWTWGGFNALCLSPLSWLKANFASFWKKSFLGE